MADGCIRIFDIHSPANVGVLHVLRGHSQSVTGLDICDVFGMPCLVSSSWDGTVRLWTLPQTQTQPSTSAHPDGGWNTTLSAVSAAAKEQSGTGGQLKCLQMFDSLGLAHDTTLVAPPAASSSLRLILPPTRARIRMDKHATTHARDGDKTQMHA